MATKNRPKPELTHERLLEALSYDPGSGEWRWRVDRGLYIKAGDIAGGITKQHGYRIIGIDKVQYRSARLAWFYVHGWWPPYELDHKDRVRDHDWIDNLRPATQRQNNANRKRYRNNRSGLKGAYFIRGRWRSYINCGKPIYLGTFDSAEEAHMAYVAKARELFGEFANAG